MNRPHDNCCGNYYQIKIKGRLGSGWEDWFEGMTVKYNEGITTLAGPVIDQAALHGLLIRIRDLGLYLISVNCVEPDRK
ncbi:MAG: hypothetical protein GXO77_03100 [Calditrichaeota bacterium]|nr:hypothetical protein [Calditrichota bacterium]